MKIYTSYFGVAKKLPPDIIKISIAGRSPDGWKDLEFKELAPKWSFFKVWQQTKDNDYYIKCYYEQVLSRLDPHGIEKELKLAYFSISYLDERNRLNRRVHSLEQTQYTPNSDVCLMCYEKPDAFCHRHLVADWLNAAGIECKEYIF